MANDGTILNINTNHVNIKQEFELDEKPECPKHIPNNDDYYGYEVDEIEENETKYSEKLVSKKRLTNDETIFLISEVRRRPCIWDPNDTGYKMVKLTARNWKEIAELMSKNDRVLTGNNEIKNKNNR